MKDWWECKTGKVKNCEAPTLAPMYLSGTQTDRWGLDTIDSEATKRSDITIPIRDGMYNSPYSGKGVHAYVVDSGIRYSHEEFGGRAIPTLDVSSGKVVECRST